MVVQYAVLSNASSGSTRISSAIASDFALELCLKSVRACRKYLRGSRRIEEYGLCCTDASFARCAGFAAGEGSDPGKVFRHA
jgi:hypothetical protein